MKKITCLGMSIVMAAMLIAGCGDKKNTQEESGSKQPDTQIGAENTEESTQQAENKEGEEISITLLNTKSELVDQFEKMAQTYKEITGVNIEVVFTSDVVGTHLAERYASGSPYTIMMVDRPDVYDFQEYLLDLSGED